MPTTEVVKGSLKESKAEDLKEKEVEDYPDRKLKKSRPSWDEYFMSVANVVAERATCLVRRTGALIVKDKRIISTGYNGTPAGIDHCIDGACERCANRTPETAGVYIDKCICCHAEENAIVQAALHGISTKGATLYTTFTPCWWCARMIINAGIKKVVCGAIYPGNDVTFDLFKQAGVEIEVFDKKVVVTKPEEIWK